MNGVYLTEVIKICGDAGLLGGDGFTQGWAYDLPEKYRTKEWLDKYITAYINNDYSLSGGN